MKHIPRAITAFRVTPPRGMGARMPWLEALNRLIERTTALREGRNLWLGFRRFNAAAVGRLPPPFWRE